MPPKKRRKSAPISTPPILVPRLKKSNTFGCATNEVPQVPSFIVRIKRDGLNISGTHPSHSNSPSSSRESLQNRFSLSSLDVSSSKRIQPQESSSLSNQNAALPTIDQFAEALQTESDWYSLGSFLGASTAELDFIEINHRGVSITRYLIELYKCLESTDKTPSWEFIIDRLQIMNKNELAKRITSKYVNSSSSSGNKGNAAIDSSQSDADRNAAIADSEEIVVPPEIADWFKNLSDEFIILNFKVKNAFAESLVSINNLQHFIQRQCGLEPLVGEEANIENVLQRLEKELSAIFDSHTLKFLVETLLSNKQLVNEIAEYETAVNKFNSSAKMCHLINLIKEKKPRSPHAKCVILKVRKIWNAFTIKKFEETARKILGTLYDKVSQIHFGLGSICISWVIPDIDPIRLGVPNHSLEFMKIIGIVSLHIGSDVIYNIEGEGCETIEAAMLQAIELKNTQALELLQTMDPDVATYTGDNAVTTIVNIRESEHVEAIVDPTSKPTECCSSCSITKTMNKQLLQEIDILRQEQTTLYSHTDELQLTVKTKDAEIEELTEQINDYKADTKYEAKMKELFWKEIEMEDVETTSSKDKQKIKLRYSNSVLKSIQSPINYNEELTAELVKDKESRYEAAKENELFSFKLKKEKVKDAEATLLKKAVGLLLTTKARQTTQTDELKFSNIKTEDGEQNKKMKIEATHDDSIHYAVAENTLLQKDVELQEKQTDKIAIEDKRKRLKNEPNLKKPIEPFISTAILPRQRLGIGAEMRVKIITRDKNRKELDNGGSTVRAVLSCNKGQCPVTNNNDGTYYVTVIPRQLGQHELSITIDNQHIQNSPFSLTIVPQRDYTKLRQPVQTIKNIDRPHYIAFSDNGDMFVISSFDHCIYVYDKSGNKKTTIGSRGSGGLQFNGPCGIGIDGDIVYVTDWGRHRIHKLTTGGEFISTFGEWGSDVNQSIVPLDVKISPDNKVYVVDGHNDHVQVFYSDWTISHVINDSVSGDGGFSSPRGIAFDLSGNVHVTSYNSVTVFTPSGQFIRQYDTTHISRPVGIAIDPSGYSLVANYNNGTLSVFDPNGVFIHSVRGFIGPWDVSVANDGGVWVTDYYKNRLVKY